MFKTLAAPAPLDLVGKRALVTGGSRGIGAAIVQRLLDGGAQVVTSARRPTDTTPRDATFLVGDVSTRDGARALAEAALAELGGIDVVVNNAAAARLHPGGVSTIPDEEWQDALDVNYLSAVRVTDALLPALRASGPGGVVVNISSAAAFVPEPVLAHYAAAKAALDAYGAALSKELGPKGIRVTTVVPGNVLTPGADTIRSDAGITPDDVAASTPLGRPGEPRDVAEAVAFLASDRAQWITGTTLHVDGGALPVV